MEVYDVFPVANFVVLIILWGWTISNERGTRKDLAKSFSMVENLVKILLESIEERVTTRMEEKQKDSQGKV